MQRIFLVAGAFAVAACIGFLAVVAFTTHRTTVPTQAVQAVANIVIPQPQSVFGKDALKVLVVGVDYDYDPKDQETSAHSRSDIIMAMNLDLQNHRVWELSVPRDMVATMPNGTQAKINEAQSEGGITEAQSVIAKWLGIPGFDRYVVLRIDTMKDLIDAIGGVDVPVKTSDCLQNHTGCSVGSVDYDDSWGHLHVHLTSGVHHLNGDQAVSYARFRHDWCSDPCRIMRQQDVVRSIVAKMKQKGVSSPATLIPLIHVINKDVDTNLRANEELSLAYAFRNLQMKDIVASQIPYVATTELPGYGDSLIPNENAKVALVRKYLLTDPDPPPTPSP